MLSKPLVYKQKLKEEKEKQLQILHYHDKKIIKSYHNYSKDKNVKVTDFFFLFY